MADNNPFTVNRQRSIISRESILVSKFTRYISVEPINHWNIFLARTLLERWRFSSFDTSKIPVVAVAVAVAETSKNVAEGFRKLFMGPFLHQP